MSDFDNALADRVREVFDGYEEPVDPAALARMRAALGHPPASTPVAPDRPPVAASRTRWRRGLWVALAAVAVLGGVWLQARGPAPSPEAVATVAPAPSPSDTSPPGAPRSSPEEGGGAAADPLLPSSPAPARPPASATDRVPPGPAAGNPRPPRTPAPEPRALPAPVAASLPTTPALDPDLPEAGTPASVPRLEVAGLPAAPDAGRPALPVVSRPLEPAPVPSNRPSEERVSPYRVVLGTSAPLGGAASVEGIGVAGGVAREWPVAGRVSVSGGALVAYNRYDIDRTRTLATTSFQSLNMDPSRRLDVAAQTRAETVALEVPLDVTVDVARVRRARLGVSVGVTSAVYLSQSFRDRGTRYSGTFVSDGVTPDGVFVVTGQPYRASEAGGPLGRVELARQLNLGVLVAGGRGPSAPSVGVYARLPLGGLTDRDLGLTTVGARLRVPLR